MIDPELAAEALGEADPLTERERQVLRLAGQGFSTARIAIELALSHGTVRNYLSEAIARSPRVPRMHEPRISSFTGPGRLAGVGGLVVR